MKKIKVIFLLTVLIFEVTPVLADKPDKAECPQGRKTPAAPPNYFKLENPLDVSAKRLEKGELLYMDEARPMPCLHCHGARGDGTGELGLQANPPARNFTCLETMRTISDGQMFWAIKNGVKGTAMPAYSGLADWQIWVLIHYIRQFTK